MNKTDEIPLLVKDTCFLKIYRSYFESLNGEKPAFPSFKKEETEYLHGEVQKQLNETVNGIMDALEETGRARWKIPNSVPFRFFYSTTYATLTSAIFRKMENLLVEKSRSFQRKDHIIYLDFENEQKELFHEINVALRQKLGQEDIRNSLFSSSPMSSTPIPDALFTIIKDKLLRIANLREIVGGLHKTELLFSSASREPRAIGKRKRVFLLDHLDRAFICEFNKEINEGLVPSRFDKKVRRDFLSPLITIGMLRKCWCSAVIRLNQEGILCIASVLTQLEGYFGTWNIGNEHLRTSMITTWNKVPTSWIVKESFCNIHEAIGYDAGSSCMCQYGNNVQCGFKLPQYIRIEEQDIRDQLKSALDSPPISTQLKCFTTRFAKGVNPWIICQSFHHSISSNGENLDCGGPERSKESTLDSNLKSYYRDENHRRKWDDGEERSKDCSLLEDYLYPLPLYIAETLLVIYKSEMKKAEKVERVVWTQWRRIVKRYTNNVISLLHYYDKQYKKKILELNKDTESPSSKMLSESNVLIGKNKVESKLKRRMPQVLRKGGQHGEILKVFIDAAVQQGVFCRAEKDTDKFYASPFMHYLYSDMKVLN